MQAPALALAFLGTLLNAGLILNGPAASAQLPPEPRVVLVELFTSEGCSSCPPADALLRKLDGMHTDSGQLIVVLSEHVTYWNQLGWLDPFSDPAYTERQNGYSDRFHLESVYTPQAVIDGSQQALGSDAAAILRAVRAEPLAGPVQLHIGAVTASAGKLSVSYTISGMPSGSLDLFAVIADDMATSSVKRGENSGRTLQHVSVARSLTRLAARKGDTSATVSLRSPAPIVGQAATGRHLILFAQAAGQGRILAVESKPLPSPPSP